MSPPQPLEVLGCHCFSVCMSPFQYNGIATIMQVRVRREANFPGLGLETFSDSHGQKVFFLDGELMTACIAIACMLRTVLVFWRAVVAHTHVAADVCGLRSSCRFVVETAAPDESNRMSWLGGKGVASGDLLDLADTSYYVHVYQEWYMSVKFWMYANRRNPVAKCQGPSLLKPVAMGSLCCEHAIQFLCV